MQLFAERAAAALDSFRLDDANAERIVAICRQLDGMPLAIELAAARVDAFGLQGLQAMLDDRLGLLRATGRRGAQARHQTLHATLEWSYGLLTAPEQLLLRRLGTFAGRFPLPALLAVACAQDLGAAEAKYMVADLVDKSLLVAELDGDHVLYRLLDTTRAYARDKLAEAGETRDCARRHAQLCLRTFQGAAREVDSSSPAGWLARYAPWVGEVRAVLDWAFATAGEQRLGVELTLATAPLWDRLMLVRENQANIERALATPHGARDTAIDMALFAALGATVSQANLSSPQMASAWARALELAERSGDRAHQLQSLWGLWVTELNKGHFHAALDLARRFCGVAEGSADANDAFVGDRLVAYTLHFLGDQAGARRHIERMLAGYRPLERQTHAFRFQFDQRVIGRMTLALVQWVQGEPEAAIACCRGQRARRAVHRPCADAVQRAASSPAARWRCCAAAPTWRSTTSSCCCGTPARTRCSCGTRSAAATRGLLRLAQGDLARRPAGGAPGARRTAAGPLRLPADLGAFGAGAGRCALRCRRAGPGDRRAGHRAGASRRRALVLARAAARARRGAAAAQRCRVARHGARDLRAGAGAGARERRAGLGAARAGQSGFAGCLSRRSARREVHSAAR